jgi:hypothetical protein
MIELSNKDQNAIYQNNEHTTEQMADAVNAADHKDMYTLWTIPQDCVTINYTSYPAYSTRAHIGPLIHTNTHARTHTHTHEGGASVISGRSTFIPTLFSANHYGRSSRSGQILLLHLSTVVSSSAIFRTSTSHFPDCLSICTIRAIYERGIRERHCLCVA